MDACTLECWPDKVARQGAARVALLGAAAFPVPSSSPGAT